MKRLFAFNILFLLGVNLLVKPLYLFGIERSVQNHVGSESYGLYYSLFAMTYLLHFLNDFGLQNYSAVSLSQRKEQQDLFTKLLGFKFITTICYLIGTIILSILLAYTHQDKQLIFHIACNQVFISLVFLMRAAIAGKGLYVQDSIISVLDRVLLILLCGIFFLAPTLQQHISISWFVWMQTISILSTAIIAGVLLLMHNIRFTVRLSNIDIKHTLKEVAPFAILFLLNILYIKSDVVILERLSVGGKQEAGVYSAALRMLEAMSMVSLAFGGLLLPMFAKLTGQQDAIQKLAALAFKMLFGLSTIIVGVLYIQAEEISNVLYTESTVYWGIVLQIVVVAFLPASLTYIFGALLQSTGLIWKLNGILAFGSILSIILNLIFVENNKSIACAIILVIVQCSVLILQISVAYFSDRFSLKAREILQLCAYLICVFCFSWLIKQMTQMHMLIQMILTGVWAVMCLFIFNIFNVEQIKQMMLLKSNVPDDGGKNI